MEKLSAEQKPDPLGGKTTRKGSRELTDQQLKGVTSALCFETATYVQPADELLRSLRNIYLIFQLYL